MPDPLYAPVLKGRQGEFNALAKIQPVTREHLLPVLVVVPGPAEEPGAVRDLVRKTVSKLRPWAGSRILLDAGYLPLDVELHDGRGSVGFTIAEARAHGIDGVPVIRLHDAKLAIRDAATVHADTGCGLAIRLDSEDLDEEAEQLGVALDRMATQMGVQPEHIDLLLDVESLDGDLGVRAGSRLVADALRGIGDLDAWRTLVVTAGAFPADLSGVQPWTVAGLPRYDAAMYDHLVQRRKPSRLPLYGDYAIAHPVLVTGGASPAPQLRYTVADRWLAIKGRRNDPRGHEQFYWICELVAKHPEFVGAELGRADARVANSRANGPGNASTWREIGTTHHLDYVVRRLTTLGEP